jgi:HK97 family phage major capsid protein
MPDILEAVKTALADVSGELRSAYARQHDEIKAMGEAAKETQDKIAELKVEWEAQLKEGTDRMDSIEAKMGRLPLGASGETKEAKDDFGFKSFGDLVHTVRFNPSDERLAKCDVKALSTDQGRAGGVLVPPRWADMLREIEPQDAIVRPRAVTIPAGDPPDGELTFPALDQGDANGVYAGVQLAWIAEGTPKPETEPQFRDIVLRPQEVAGHTVVTDKLLRNAPASGVVVENLLRRAAIGEEDFQFLRGDGVGKPRGIVGHPATITLPRVGAGQIVYQDLVNMYSRALMGAGSYVWVASQTALPDLMTMTTPLGQLIWQPNAREGMPGTLLGLPLLVNGRQPMLGQEGDLMLCCWDFYLIKNGSGPFIEASPHPLFTRNRTIIKITWNVDGQPWINSPLLLEDGATTVSPFVALQ